MDCSPPGSSLQVIIQARILEWVAISFSKEYSRPRDQNCVSCISRRILYHWATKGSPYELIESLIFTFIICINFFLLSDNYPCFIAFLILYARCLCFAERWQLSHVTENLRSRRSLRLCSWSVLNVGWGDGAEGASQKFSKEKHRSVGAALH